MHPMLNIAVRAVRKAGNLIAKKYEILTTIRNDYSNNLLNTIEYEAENLIVSVIRNAYPKHTIFTEKKSNFIGENKDIIWIIKPLDSIENFIKCLPYCSVSIAIRVKERTEIAVIYDPILNELFSAVRGQGTQLNGYRLRSNHATVLKNSIMNVGSFCPSQEYNQLYINTITKLFNNKYIDFRRTGSTGIDMAYLAAGRIDSYFAIGLQFNKFAAGELLIRESGSLITDFDGSHNYLISGNIIAGNAKILKTLLSIMRNN
ncbi:MAG: inositol-1-monophosphatase [Pantoea sp. Brub]|nr:inositol-1-monophosphatase [Pantoea sp. Brub]